MKLNIISDLHCLPSREENKFGFHNEWFDFEPEKLEPADYLIVAGDMGLFENNVDVIKELKLRTEGKFKDILWIRGNHDYWLDGTCNWFSYLDDDFVSICKNKTIDFNDGNIAFIGTTLWTNSFNDSELDMMNDYRYIPSFNGKLKVKLFEEQSSWLKQRYAFYKNLGKKIVIITHHIPRSLWKIPEYSRCHHEVHTAYWVNNRSLDEIKPDIWICGHIHEDFDGIDDGVRFIRHPIGYRWGAYRLNPNLFPEDAKTVESWYNKIVEI